MYCAIRGSPTVPSISIWTTYWCGVSVPPGHRTQSQTWSALLTRIPNVSSGNLLGVRAKYSTFRSRRTYTELETIERNVLSYRKGNRKRDNRAQKDVTFCSLCFYKKDLHRENNVAAFCVLVHVHVTSTTINSAYNETS